MLTDSKAPRDPNVIIKIKFLYASNIETLPARDNNPNCKKNIKLHPQK
jgi:hypothetical protein